MKKKERRLYSLLGSYPCPAFHFGYISSHEEWWASYLQNNAYHLDSIFGKFLKKRAKDLKAIEELRIEFGMSVKELADLWYNVRLTKEKLKSEYNKKPAPEGRDNKGVYVGSGGHTNNNKVRYPSRKRSKRTWKIFYEMFPLLAKKDGWNGETSKRMK
jgi:hypothetical protein